MNDLDIEEFNGASIGILLQAEARPGHPSNTCMTTSLQSTPCVWEVVAMHHQI